MAWCLDHEKRLPGDFVPKVVRDCSIPGSDTNSRVAEIHYPINCLTCISKSNGPAGRADVVGVMRTFHNGRQSRRFQHDWIALAVCRGCKYVRRDFSFHRRRSLRFGKHRRGIVKD
jgi:hypothetical protein